MKLNENKYIVECRENGDQIEGFELLTDAEDCLKKFADIDRQEEIENRKMEILADPNIDDKQNQINKMIHIIDWDYRFEEFYSIIDSAIGERIQ